MTIGGGGVGPKVRNDVFLDGVFLQQDEKLPYLEKAVLE